MWTAREGSAFDRVLNEIEEMPGIVLYTLLQENLAARLEEKHAPRRKRWHVMLSNDLPSDPHQSQRR